jgi:hypothetical protein
MDISRKPIPPPQVWEGGYVPDDYSSPERIIFIRRFIDYMKRIRSPVTLPPGLKPSAPSETPPFAWRNIGKSSIKLKGKTLPREPTCLQVELLLRRFQPRFHRFEDYVDSLAGEALRLSRSVPELKGLPGRPTSEREPRFILKQDFGEEILSRRMESDTFDWLARSMEAFLRWFEPIIKRLDGEFGR